MTGFGGLQVAGIGGHPGTLLAPTGWIGDNNAWAYSSPQPANLGPHSWQIQTPDPTAIVPTYLDFGDKFLLTQSSAKYFKVSRVTNDGTNTYVVLYGGQNYTLTSAAITAPYLSHEWSPVGYNPDPIGWSEVFTTASSITVKSTPTSGVWYVDAAGTGGIPLAQLTCPIGSWTAEFEAILYAPVTAASSFIYLSAALSTSSSSVSNNRLWAADYKDRVSTGGAYAAFTPARHDLLTVTAATTYYAIAQATFGEVPGSLNWSGGALVIRFRPNF